MKHKKKSYLPVCAALLFTLSITACSSGKAGESPTVSKQVESQSTTELDTDADDEMAETSNLGEASEKEEPAKLTNPIKAVASSDDFELLGVKLVLDSSWHSNASYSIIDGKVAQIRFFDEITKSDAIARAGKEEYGDPSGIYYVFDESQQESWFTELEDGTNLYITLQVTTENSDVHGVLATWKYNGTLYSLWEDNARETPDSVAKMAIQIAKDSE